MKIGITTHEFEKQNLVTVFRGKKVYDRVKCRLCGLEGIRYGLESFVSVKYDKRCKKGVGERVQITSQYVCQQFGFDTGVVYDRCGCPDEYKDRHGRAVWVYSEKRKEPVRLLDGEFVFINDN